MSAFHMRHPTSFIHRVWSLLCHAEGLICLKCMIQFYDNSFMMPIDNAELEITAGVVSDSQ